MAQASVSSLNSDQMPKGSEAESKDTLAPLIPPSDGVSGRAVGTRPSCHWRSRMKVPTCHIPKVPAKSAFKMVV